jgi:hypothetical protein
MGMDVWGESCVYARSYDMVKLVTTKNVKQILPMLMAFTSQESAEKFFSNKKTKVSFHSSNFIKQEYPWDKVFEEFKSLTLKSKVNEVRSVLSDCIYVNRCEIVWKDAIEAIWYFILNLHPTLPFFMGIKVFVSETVSGDVPMDTACFRFEVNECFEQILTEKGKALSKALRCKIEESEYVSAYGIRYKVKK